MHVCVVLCVALLPTWFHLILFIIPLTLQHAEESAQTLQVHFLCFFIPALVGCQVGTEAFYVIIG